MKTKLNNTQIFFLYWFPVIAWMAIIFKLSSIPAAQLPAVPKGFWMFMAHKTAHLIEYGGLGVLSIRAWRAAGLTALPYALVWLVTAIFVFGLSDEFHQSFVPGRHPQLKDALMDAAFACIALLLYLRACSPRRRI